MNIVIISGQSGAGKSQAKKVFEDLGYYCVDNLPPALMMNFIELIRGQAEDIGNVAFVLDVRGGEFFKALEANLETLQHNAIAYTLFFFEASKEVLIQRYKETRRAHPIDVQKGLEAAILEEKKRLESLRSRAQIVIDTSDMTLSQLKRTISEALNVEQKTRLVIMSFGYKRGIPQEADYVFDVRFLSNPYYVPELRPLTGNDAAVRDYVLKAPLGAETVEQLRSFIDWALVHLLMEGRDQIVIAVGCTGGQHRSVAVANALCEHYTRHGHMAVCTHRDIDKNVEVRR